MNYQFRIYHFPKGNWTPGPKARSLKQADELAISAGGKFKRGGEFYGGTYDFGDAGEWWELYQASNVNDDWMK